MIYLTDNYYLDADENCFLLIFWEGKTRLVDGKTLPANPRTRYYSTLENAFRGLFKLLSRRAVQNSTNMDELLTAYRGIEQTINDLFNSDSILAIKKAG